MSRCTSKPNTIAISRGPTTKNSRLLLTDIGAGHGVELKPEYRETYVTAPPLPIHYVERTEALDPPSQRGDHRRWVATSR